MNLGRIGLRALSHARRAYVFDPHRKKSVSPQRARSAASPRKITSGYFLLGHISRMSQMSTDVHVHDWLAPILRCRERSEEALEGGAEGWPHSLWKAYNTFNILTIQLLTLCFRRRLFWSSPIQPTTCGRSTSESRSNFVQSVDCVRQYIINFSLV